MQCLCSETPPACDPLGITAAVLQRYGARAAGTGGEIGPLNVNKESDICLGGL